MSRAAFIMAVRERLRTKGVELAAAVMGAATRRIMGAKSQAEAWTLDENLDPEQRMGPEADALFRSFDEDFESMPLDLCKDVQEAARLALADLGFRAEITRVH